MNFKVIGGSEKGKALGHGGKMYYYWIAINGGSCALSVTPMRVFPTVNPTPQNLIGFRTLEEAQEAQHFLLTASIPDCERRISELLLRAQSGEIIIVVPEDPEPPVNPGEPTLWMELPVEKQTEVNCGSGKTRSVLAFVTPKVTR
jgi:hypothetical protein